MKFGTLQAGRGVAACSVVLVHTAVYFSDDPRFWKIPAYSRLFSFGNFGVSFFFVLSGIVILLAHWGDLGRPSQLVPYAWKRFRRIFPIYWIVLIPVLALYWLMPSLGTGVFLNPWTFISSLTLIHIHSDASILLVAWSLFCEILFYAAFAVVILHRRIGYAVLALWLAASAALTIYPGPGWLYSYFFPQQILFGVGMLVAVSRKKPFIRRASLLIPFGILVIVTAILGIGHIPGSMPNIIAGLGCAPLIAGLMELERRGTLAVSRAWLFLGDASYAIYLVHMSVLSLVVRYAYRFHAVPATVLFVSAAIIATSAGLLLHVAVERPMLARIPTRLGHRSEKENGAGDGIRTRMAF